VVEVSVHLYGELQFGACRIHMTGV